MSGTTLPSIGTPVKLRPYQTAAIEAMRAHIRRGLRRLILTAPTGSGKTSIAAEMIRSALSRGRRALFLAHRRELLDQCHDRLAENGVSASIVRADDPRIDPANPVQIASIQTLVRRLDQFAPEAFDLVIVDECHHVRASTYEKILNHFSGATAVIGLTATPCRKDGRGLAEAFDGMVQAASIRDLIGLGFLVPVRMFTAPQIDLSGVHTTGGDYQLNELGERMSSHVLVGNIVDEWRRLASDRPTVIFATTVAHSKSIVERFRGAGVKAEHLDGETPEIKRDQILNRVKRGRTQVIVNCQLFTEGWDMPAISCCVLARPTKSLGLYLQMAGRALRPAPGKGDCIIIDHGNNFLAHGPVDEEREWSLTGDAPALTADVSAKSGEAAAKRCAGCGLIVPAAARICPECGFVFVRRNDQRSEAKVQLVEASEASAAIQREKRSEFFRIVNQVRQLRRADGSPYRPTAAVAKYRQQFLEWPAWDWQREAGIR